MKVYVVTQGCYSDYHICGIFATEEAAKTYCEEANYFEVRYDDDCSYHEEEVIEKQVERIDKPCNVEFTFCNGVIDDDKTIISDVYYDKSDHLVINTDEFEDEFGGTIKIAELNFPMVARKDETLEQFKDRAKKVAIDKYYLWKQGVSNV